MLFIWHKSSLQSQQIQPVVQTVRMNFELNLVLVLLSSLAYFHRSTESFPASAGSKEYSNAAVATDAEPCSKIGADILKKGGSAVDAAISSLLCVGLVNLHSTGIGGGGFMLVYEAATKQAHALDYREVAPLAATYDMYKNEGPDASKKGQSTLDTR